MGRADNDNCSLTECSAVLQKYGNIVHYTIVGYIEKFSLNSNCKLGIPIKFPGQFKPNGEYNSVLISSYHNINIEAYIHPTGLLINNGTLGSCIKDFFMIVGVYFIS